MNSADKSDAPLTGRVVRGIGWAYISSFLKAISQIVFIAVLSRILEPRDFGLLGMALVITNVAERLGQLGLGPALIQRQEINDTHVKVCRAISLMLGFFVAALVCALSPAISDFFREPLLKDILMALSVIFIFEGMCVVYESWLIRKLKFKDLAVVENFSYFFGNCLIAVPCAIYGLGVWSLVYSQIAIRVSKYISLLVLSKPPSGFSVNKQGVKDLLALGSGFSLGRILNLAALQGDNFIVGRVLGADALGLYSRVYQLMTIPAVYVAAVLDRVLFPALALRQANTKTIGKSFLLLVEVVSLLSLPMTAVALIIPDTIVHVLFGRQWSEAAPILQIFAIGIFFRAGYKCGDTVARSMGAVFRYSTLQLVYATCVIAGSLIGASWGLIGVAWAVLTAEAVNYLCMSGFALRLTSIGWNQFFKSHLPGIWISLWVAAGSGLIDFFIPDLAQNEFLQLALVGIVGIFSAALALICAPNWAKPLIISFFLSKQSFASRIEKNRLLAPFIRRFRPAKVS